MLLLLVFLEFTRSTSPPSARARLRVRGPPPARHRHRAARQIKLPAHAGGETKHAQGNEIFFDVWLVDPTQHQRFIFFEFYRSAAMP